MVAVHLLGWAEECWRMAVAVVVVDAARQAHVLLMLVAGMCLAGEQAPELGIVAEVAVEIELEVVERMQQVGVVVSTIVRT